MGKFNYWFQKLTFVKVLADEPEKILLHQTSHSHPTNSHSEIKNAFTFKWTLFTRWMEGWLRNVFANTAQQNQFMKNSFVNVRFTGAKMLFSLVWQHQLRWFLMCFHTASDTQNDFLREMKFPGDKTQANTSR